MCSISTLTLLENFLQSSGLLRTKCIRTCEWVSYVLEPTLCEVREIRTSHGNIVSAPTICTWMACESITAADGCFTLHCWSSSVRHTDGCGGMTGCLCVQSNSLHSSYTCIGCAMQYTTTLWTRSGYIKKLFPSNSFDVCTDTICLWFLYLSQLIFVGLAYFDILIFSVTIATLLTLP